MNDKSKEVWSSPERDSISDEQMKSNMTHLIACLYIVVLFCAVAATCIAK